MLSPRPRATKRTAARGLTGAQKVMTPATSLLAKPAQSGSADLSPTQEMLSDELKIVATLYAEHGDSQEALRRFLRLITLNIS